jgi:uncharacterized protein YggL (DUF469 family)
MNKRIRKKHRVGEYTEWGFAATFTLADHVTGAGVHEFLERLTAEVLEPRGLQCGGGGDRGWELFVFKPEGQSASEEDRAAVSGWLTGRAELIEVTVSPLTDAREEDEG